MQRQGVLWIVVLVLVASSAAAENLDALAHTTPEQRAAEQTRMMKSRLDLSADQVGQVQKYTAAKQEMRRELEQKLAKKVGAGGS